MKALSEGDHVALQVSSEGIIYNLGRDLEGYKLHGGEKQGDFLHGKY